MDETNATDLLQTNLNVLSYAECRKLLTLYMTQQKLGLYWERNQIEHDKALNSDAVFLRLAEKHGQPLSITVSDSLAELRERLRETGNSSCH